MFLMKFRTWFCVGFVGMARTLCITLNFKENILQLWKNRCHDFIPLSFTFDSELKTL